MTYHFICSSNFLLFVDYGHVMRHLTELGHSVVAHTSTPPTEDQKRNLDAVEVRELPFNRTGGRLNGLFQGIRHSRALASAATKDSVFTLVAAQAHIPYGMALRFTNRNTLFLMCGMGTLFSSKLLRFRLIRPLVKALYSYFYRGKNSRVIVQNSDDRILASSLGAHKPTVMPGCGVDTDRFTYFEAFPQNQKKIILVPSRVIVEKGIFEVAKASAILTSRGVAHQMWVSSDIDPGNPMTLTREDLATLCERSPDLRFLGFQDDMAGLYRSCNVVCLASYREGLPTALVEASACGRPIVTTNVQGCREIVVHNETGLIVPPRDPGALADALERILLDDELADRLRKSSYQRFLTHFTRRASLDSTLPVYASFNDT